MNIKAVVLILTCTIILHAPDSWPQIAGVSQPVVSRDANALLRKYAATAGLPGAKDKAEVVAGQRLSVSAENVNLLRKSLTSKVSEEERVLLLGMLGQMYSRDNASGMNAAIIKDVLAHTTSPSIPVARAATFAFSRMGSNEDVIAVLKQAKRNAVIDNDAFAGELGHAFRFLPKDRQREALTLLEASNSIYGNDVVVMNLKSRVLVDQVAQENLTDLETFLRRNEARFPMAISTYGIITALRYSDWLHTFALVSSKLGRGSYSDVVLGVLNDKRIDPRKIVAYLSSQEGKELMASSGNRAQFSPLLDKARQFAQMFPSNAIVTDIVRDLNAFSATLKL